MPRIPRPGVTVPAAAPQPHREGLGLAKAQPFEDGNKRTAVFVANSLLVGSDAGVLLTIPVDDNDPSLSGAFHDLLTRAYVYGEHDGVKDLLRLRGLTRLGQEVD